MNPALPPDSIPIIDPTVALQNIVEAGQLSPTSVAATFPRLRPVLAPVLSIEEVAAAHFVFRLHAPSIAARARAGQFVHVLPRDNGLSEPLLRRAFSILAVEAEDISILFRVEGIGTAQLAKTRPGDVMDILGPLGRPFDLSPLQQEMFHVKQTPEIKGNSMVPILVGGGVGMPPLIFLGTTLVRSGVRPSVLIGARSAAEVLGRAEFDALGIEAGIATDDGSEGHRGRVTELLETALQFYNKRNQVVIYSCGPLPMLRAVACLAEQFGVPCQVSLEENMPCGIGVCNGCVVAMRPDKLRTDLDDIEVSGDSEASCVGSDYGLYQRICVVGPALWSDTVDWERC